MKSCKYKAGVTLIEMVVVVAIIALLVSMVIRVATRTDNQSRERLTESTIAILTAALEQFGDYGYNYQSSDYTNLDFPLDCNNYPFSGLPNPDLETTLGSALGATVSIDPLAGSHDPKYSGSEVMYFFLSRVPQSRKTLDKIDSSLITNIGSDGREMSITVGSKVYPLLRIIDPWGITLRYDYYNEWETNLTLRNEGKRTFPVITSAGPDRRFGTIDDISSR